MPGLFFDFFDLVTVLFVVWHKVGQRFFTGVRGQPVGAGFLKILL